MFSDILKLLEFLLKKDEAEAMIPSGKTSPRSF